MNLPTLNLALLPDLAVPTGMFGSLKAQRAPDDAIVILATFLYETGHG